MSLHGETCGEVRLDHSTMTVDHVTSASSTGFVRRKGRVRVTTGSGEAAEEVARILRERVCGRQADDGVHCRRSQPTRSRLPSAACNGGPRSSAPCFGLALAATKRQIADRPSLRPTRAVCRVATHDTGSAASVRRRPLTGPSVSANISEVVAPNAPLVCDRLSWAPCELA